MPPKKELPLNVINPFSDAFLEKWQAWKDYRWDEHKFKYKGVFSEQAALMKLNELSAGDEQKAWLIIKQSMEGPWKGLFPLNKSNIQNGTKQSVAENRTELSHILGSSGS